MKRRFNNVLWVMLGLILVMGAVGLGGCSKDDDDLKGDVYKGYITYVDTEYKTSGIKVTVTGSPYKKDEDMPLKNDLLIVKPESCANFDLKIGDKLSFRIISCVPVYNEFDPFMDPTWYSEIEILEVY